MQKTFDRRQMLRRSFGIAGSMLATGCGVAERSPPADPQLAADVRSDFERGDVVVCNGYVLSRTEYRLHAKDDRC